MMAAIIATVLIAIVLAYSAYSVYKAMTLYRAAFQVALQILLDNRIKPDDDKIGAALDALRGDRREERT